MNTEYTQIQQITQDKGSKFEVCNRVFCWISQIFVWIMLLITILIYIKGKTGVWIPYAFFLVVFFLVYMGFEFSCPTCIYLFRKKSGNEISEIMRNLFRAHPDICFHYEAYNRDGEDNNKVITYKEDFYIPYYSSRDVSGLFYLNCDKNLIGKITFIKLKLEEEINFADAISYMDYELYKRDFCKKIRPVDTHNEYWETRTISGLNHHYLVSIGGKNPCTVNFFLFFLSVIFTVCQFYKIYVNSLCLTQNFKIRKIVSTRYDLNQPIYKEKYSKFDPYLNLITQQCIYDQSDFNYLNQDIQSILPHKEELEKAKQYENKIPIYIISNGDGNIPAGVILDNPNYSSFERKLRQEDYA